MFTVFSRKEEKLILQAAALTDRGIKRAGNEDTVLAQTGPSPACHRGIYIVGDGIGGLQAGAEASRLAVEIISTEFNRLLFSNSHSSYQPPLAVSLIPQAIKTAITHAQTQIQMYAQTRPQIQAMGTTITLAIIDNNTAYIGNVGDSRVYLHRQGHVTQITQDHSWAAELVRMGKIDESDVAKHPRRNMLYRSLGTSGDDEVIVDLFERKLEAGDKLLLCSDGLWQAFSQYDELAEWLGKAGSPADTCRHLVAEAKRRDGSDNVSAIVVNVAENDCPSPRRSIINWFQHQESVFEK